jgi:beta-N-acetylhexosaminidase
MGYSDGAEGGFDVGRRRAALAVALVLMAGCTRPTAEPSPPASITSLIPSPRATATPPRTRPQTSASPPAGPTCEALAASMPISARIGELFMIGVPSTSTPAKAAGLARTYRAGSVLLVGTSSAGVEKTAALTAAIRAAKPGTLVATDQEGGKVQRLQGPGFDIMPSAMAQSQLSPETLTASATAWGKQLSAAGVLFDLAPVADVVPEANVETNAPIGALQRGYGSDPDAVSSSVAAFIAGMHAAGLEISLKHFPGLGEVTGNTDKTPATDTVTTRGASSATFRAGIGAGAGAVMVSSAIYTQIDPGVQGVFSSVIISDMLRGDLGFTGVVVSDDLGLAKAVAPISPGDRALRFLVAGGDLIINANLSIQTAMASSVAERARTKPDFAARVTQSAGRVLRLKASVGAAICH